MKGQISLEYIVAIVLFISFSVYIAAQIRVVMPEYITEVNMQRLQSETYQMSSVLVNDVGLPDDWGMLNLGSMEMQRLGLGSSSPQMNRLNMTKVTQLAIRCGIKDINGISLEWDANYKRLLDTEYTVYFNISRANDGVDLVVCTPTESFSSKSKTVRITRFVTFSDGNYGNLTMVVG